METFLFDILQIAVIAVCIVVVRYLVPAFNVYIENSKYSWISDVVSDAVEAAEQTVKEEKSGAKKKAMVLDSLGRIFKAYNISITEDQIESLIESAVYMMKLEQEKNK